MALPDPVSYRCGEFRVDAANRRFCRDAAEVDVEPKVFAVLLQLLAHAGQLVRRDELLDAVWGHRFVTPSTLNRVISLARRAFGDDSDVPRFIQTVHGAGYRYIGPIESDEAAPIEPKARFAPPPAARLPARTQALIGRSDEIDQMAGLLAAGRALTVVGAGGMGKTQCALEFARRTSDRYKDGVWFFDLAPMQQPGEWLTALAAALGITPSAEDELVAKVCLALARREALLFLDNCDRLSTGVGALLHRILRVSDHLKVLATSQQQLNFLGERILPIPPLALPAVRRPMDESDLREIAAAPAVALLLARVQAVRPAFALTIENSTAIVQICARLDGMPLAIELAAARFALLSPEQILERLDHRFRFLVSDVAGRELRHRNLMALLDWSFSLLSAKEQELLAWLSVFVQGWSVDAAIDLASALGHEPEVLVDLLAALVNKSLVVADQSASPPRYRLLESVREFALNQLAASGAEQRARDAHVALVKQMVEAAHRDMVAGRVRERIAMLRLEHGNIESAVDHALGSSDLQSNALRIAGALPLYIKSSGAFALGVRICQRALSTSVPAAARERARTLLTLGITAFYCRDAGAPDQWLAGALQKARAAHDEWAEGLGAAYLALLLAEAGRVDETPEFIAIVERIASALNDDLLRGHAGLARGFACPARGTLTEAVDVLAASLELGPDLHTRHFISVYLGLGLFGLGRHAAAAVWWYEGMIDGIALRNARGVAALVEGCAYLAAHRGNFQEAARFLGSAARVRKQTDAPLFSFWRPYHDQTVATLRVALGPGYESDIAAGAEMREEDVANEVAARLREARRS
jgi:predicted ATPase/DNA-binding winged helix-turn-helix (wHTH) protein